MTIVRRKLLIITLATIPFLVKAESKSTSASDAAFLNFIKNEGSAGVNMTLVPELNKSGFQNMPGLNPEENVPAGATKNSEYTDTTKTKKTKAKQKRKLLKKQKAEQEILSAKRRRTDEYIHTIQQLEMDRLKKSADEYFRNFITETSKSRKEFIRQLNANPESVLKDHPEEELLIDEGAVESKFGRLK